MQGGNVRKNISFPYIYDIWVFFPPPRWPRNPNAAHGREISFLDGLRVLPPAGFWDGFLGDGVFPTKSAQVDHVKTRAKVGPLPMITRLITPLISQWPIYKAIYKRLKLHLATNEYFSILDVLDWILGSPTWI